MGPKEKPMKILRVIPSINPEKGGPMEAARKIDLVLKELGHEVEVFTLDSSSDKFVKEYPCVVTALGPVKPGYKYSRAMFAWLSKNFNRFDVVIVNGIWQYHSFAVWRVLSGTDKPYVVFTHGMLDPWFKRQYPLKHLKKWLYWPWAEYRVLRDASAVVFTSEEERLEARKSFWLYKAKEKVAAYGTAGCPDITDGAGELFLQANPGLRGKRILLFLSRIHEKKGCDLLIEAFATRASVDKSLHLVIAGPDYGEYAKTLKRRVSELGLESRVTWPGMLQGEMKWSVFRAAEVFCLPSHQENFGIAVAEALSAGLPVLISNKINIWREIELDQAGFISADTVDGVEQNLSRWLKLSCEEKKDMALRARGCFERRFQVQQAATSLLHILQEVVQ